MSYDPIQIINIYAAGNSLHRTAELCNTNMHFVLKALKENNIQRRQRGRLKGTIESALKNPQRNKQMVELYAAGKTLEEIGSIYEITSERVRQILNMVEGQPAARRFNRSERVRTERDALFEKVREAVSENLTIREAAENLGMSSTGINSLAKELGLEFKSAFHDSRERDAETVRLYAQGVKISEIAEAIGEKYETHVHLRLRRAGVVANRLPGSGNFKKENRA